MSKMYIAGPMTGYPNHNFAAFDAAKVILTAEGFEVCSPADISRNNICPHPVGDDGTISAEAYSFFVKLNFVELLTCQRMVVLDGWQKSRGAKLEVAVAQACGIPVYEFSSGDDLKQHVLTEVVDA